MEVFQAMVGPRPRSQQVSADWAVSLMPLVVLEISLVDFWEAAKD
jgi:hypothetical protein